MKICGITRVPHAVAAAKAGADAIGLIFWPGTPRVVTHAQARAIVAALPPYVTVVGLFVDPTPGAVRAALDAVPLDLLQFHGSETPERLAAIKDRFRLKVMKAIKVAGESDLQTAKPFFGVADWLMFDAKPPKDRAGALPGGNALAFDWELLSVRRWPLPWMLSGGLNPDNLAEAARISRAEVLDVSSGVERRPGEKDPEKIRAFLARAKAL